MLRRARENGLPTLTPLLLASVDVLTLKQDDKSEAIFLTQHNQHAQTDTVNSFLCVGDGTDSSKHEVVPRPIRALEKGLEIRRVAGYVRRTPSHAFESLNLSVDITNSCEPGTKCCSKITTVAFMQAF